MGCNVIQASKLWELVMYGYELTDFEWRDPTLVAEQAARRAPRRRPRVERFFNRIKHFRRVATRYEKHASNYLAMLKLACIKIWMRVYESMA